MATGGMVAPTLVVQNPEEGTLYPAWQSVFVKQILAHLHILVEVADHWRNRIFAAA